MVKATKNREYGFRAPALWPPGMTIESSYEGLTMAVLLSNIDGASADFARNAEAMRRAVEDLRDKLAKATRGGTDEARARHTKRGKLLVRDRIAALLDPGSPFLELSVLA